MNSQKYTTRLNHEEIEYLGKPIISKEIESVIKNIRQRISPGPNDFTGKFYKIVKEVMPTLLKLFHKMEEEETF